VRQRSLRSALAAQHPSNFCHSFILLHNQNRAGCALSALVFRHLEVVMRTGCHLRQVGHRQHLPTARKRLEQMLDARMNPAMRYFIDVFVGSFSLPLDELNAH
jgi:hypothetical protein